MRNLSLPRRRLFWLNLAIVLAMVISVLPFNVDLPGRLPDLGPEIASAHNLNASVVYAFFDPTTQKLLDDRIAGGWTPGTPLIQPSDELGIILKVVPDSGTTTGVGGYTTFYVPNGIQVVDAGFVMPGDFVSDGILGWDKVPAKGQAQMPIVGAGGGPTVSLVGITRGPNILGVSSPIVTSGNVNLGTLPGVYGDTGIFYSTVPETAFGTYSGGALQNNSGDNPVGLRTVLSSPLNLWDAWQMAAYGIAGSANPSYPSAALVDSNQRGYAPWGLANVVAGPQSGYAWEFDFAKYTACDPTPTGTPLANCIDQATQDVGPWQRIKYPGSQFSDDPPGGTPSLPQPYTRGADASNSGFALSPANPLPLTTGQSNGTPNAVRWAFGQLTYLSPEYAWVKVKVANPAGIVDPSGCPMMYVDTFGGDAGGDSGGKDHIWRYYDPNSVTFNGCLAVGKPANREFVKSGDTYQYSIKVYNLANITYSNVTVKDTLPSGVTFLSAVPAQNSGPNPLQWNNIGALVGDMDGLFEPGEKFEATVSVKSATSGVICNTVTVTGQPPSGPVSQATSGECTPSSTVPLLRQLKSVTPTSISPGGQVEYTIDVKNVGSGPSGSPVTITEFMPGGFTYVGPLVSATLNGADVTGTTTVNASNPAQPVITVSGAINPGKELVIKFKAQVAANAAPGSYCNSYRLTQNDINTLTGALACVNVGAASIGDTVFRDWDGDGAQETGEEGISGVALNLYGGVCPPSGPILQTKTTNSSGQYLFTGLTAGTYCVDAPAPGSGGVPTGYSLTTANDPVSATVALNEQKLDVDFGYQPGGVGSIGDLVWNDINGDGVFNGAETGIANITVNLYEDSNGNGAIDSGDLLIATTSTNGSGVYGFAGLATGLSYIVKVDETDPDLATYFNPNTFTNTTPNPQSVMPADFTAQSGNVTDADFGYKANLPGSIGDTVCIDVNLNGQCDVGEPGIANITVSLYRDLNGDGAPDPDELVTTTSTDATGLYLFATLGPDDYIAVVDADDPDLPASLFPVVRQYDVPLSTGQNDLTADFPFANGLTKTVDKAVATAGQSLNFALKPYYPGGELLENVRVIDPLPTGTTYVTASANAGGTFGAYTPLAAGPGNDPAGGPAGTTTLDTAITVSTNFVNVGGSVNVTLNVKSSVAVSDVSPTDFTFSGGNTTCTGPTPASGNVPSGGAGVNFVWACTLTDAGEYSFSAAAEDTTTDYSWPQAVSASVLSAPDGGPNVITWSLGTNAPNVPGETLVSGFTAGIYAFRGGNTKEFSKYATAWATRAQPTNGIEKGGSLTGDGAGTLYALEGNSKIFYKYDIATNTWSTLANTSDNTNEGGAVQYLSVSGTEYVFALLGGSNRFRRYSVSGNSWSNMANAPSTVRKGGALTTDGTNLYALRGDRQKSFWRYNVGANTWTALANTPANVGWGGALARIGNSIYALQGDGKKAFWRYNISTNAWTALASTPGNVADGGALATDGTYVYALQGKTKTFWRYSPTTNTWTTPPSVSFTGNVGQGGALVYDPGSTPVGYFSVATAAPSLVSTSDTVKVSLRFQSQTASNNVTPSALTIVNTGGASASCGSPTLTSADDDIVDINDPVTYEWICTVTAGANPGSLTFSASATGSGPSTYPSASSKSVLVNPVLTFQTTVNAGAPAMIENTGLLAETAGIFDSIPSNTTQTATGASIGDRVWADLDGDGVQDAGEPGISGVEVCATPTGGGAATCATTDALGNYRIAGLTNNASYDVSPTPATYPTGYAPSTPTTLTRVAITAGVDDADFGLRPLGTASIGDTVWVDSDEDGILDPVESGLPGITVRLYIDQDNDGVIDGGDTLLQTTTTDANGNYLFTGLHPDDYLVEVDETGVVTTEYGVNTTIAAAMDLVSGDNPRDVTIATPGEAITDTDFGYNWGGSIGDYAWYDDNGNALQDPGELPAPNASVVLYYDLNGDGQYQSGEPILGVDESDANGAYLFDNLPPGDYVVQVSEQEVPAPPTSANAGLIGLMVATTGTEASVTLSPSEDRDNVDWGFIEAGEIGGHVFHDDNRNTLFDPSETPLAAITVWLDLDVDGLLDPGEPSTTTDSAGEYSFIVPPGSYTIAYNTSQTTAAGYPAPTTPTSIVIPVAAGQEIEGLDFGVDYTGEIGDTVFNDANANGTQDSGEPGIAAVTVWLLGDNDNSGDLSPGDTFEASTITNAQGKYLFPGLKNGNYVVFINAATLPVDFGQTADPDVAGVCGINCDDQGAATVSGGGSDLTIDFGYVYAPLGGSSNFTIGGSVYEDTNGDGSRQPLEPGFANVEVIVVCDSGAFTTFTDNNGDWFIAGIVPGSTCSVLDADENDLPRTDYTPTETPGTPIVVNNNIIDLNFGYEQQPGSISGTVCNGNGDGLCDDPGDTPMQGVTITLNWAGPDGILGTADDTTATDTTDANGDYSFSGLQPGLYQIVETNPLGYISVADADGGNPDNISATLSLAGNVTNRDFEDTVLTGDLGDFVFLDSNGDGTQAPGETTGISGVQVTAVNQTTNAVYTAITNGLGFYLFDDIPAGLYLVSTPANLPNLVRTTNPLTVSVPANGQNLSADFGYIAPTAITLTAFTVAESRSGVLLRWSTAQEEDLDGFVIWRASTADGEYETVSDVLPAGNDPTGSAYEWLDASAKSGVTYWYKIEVQPDGVLYGPIPSRVEPGPGGSARVFIPRILR